jgi:hypothetical protein
MESVFETTLPLICSLIVTPILAVISCVVYVHVSVLFMVLLCEVNAPPMCYLILKFSKSKLNVTSRILYDLRITAIVFNLHN